MRKTLVGLWSNSRIGCLLFKGSTTPSAEASQPERVALHGGDISGQLSNAEKPFLQHAGYPRQSSCKRTWQKAQRKSLEPDDKLEAKARIIFLDAEGSPTQGFPGQESIEQRSVLLSWPCTGHLTAHRAALVPAIHDNLQLYDSYENDT